MYYEYLDRFHLRPATIEELFEGICYLSTVAEAKEIYKEK